MKAMLLFAFGLLAPQTNAPLDRRYQVEVVDDEGETFCTLQADNAPLFDVLREIADRGSLTLDGFDTSWRKTLISADLRRRPLRQVLTFVLGSVGLTGELRQGAIYLHDGLETAEESDQLYDAALAAYLRTLREFPEHALAPEATRSQARIEERRGRIAAARAHYESLIERHPGSDLAPEALYKSGELLMREGAWQEASNRLSDLLRLERKHDYEFKARLELAWCVAELGEFERAMYMVDALDAVEPATSDAEELRRSFVRARAFAGLGQGQRALTILDDVDARLVDGSTRRISLEVRATAYQAAGFGADAARAWIAFSDLAEGEERARALRSAARLAVDAGDELGALFITELAKRHGVDLSTVAREARVRLSLDQLELSSNTLAQRLVRAERLIESGLFAEAFTVLQLLEAQISSLDEPTRARFSVAYGRVLARELGVNSALEHFRDVLPTFETEAQRRALYLLAGELLENEGRLDDAIEAYQGRL